MPQAQASLAAASLQAADRTSGRSRRESAAGQALIAPGSIAPIMLLARPHAQRRVPMTRLAPRPAGFAVLRGKFRRSTGRAVSRDVVRRLGSPAVPAPSGKDDIRCSRHCCTHLHDQGILLHGGAIASAFFRAANNPETSARLALRFLSRFEHAPRPSAKETARTG